MQDWIFKHNLRPFVEMVSSLAEYEFDMSDWLAIDAGVEGTDELSDVWFTYPLLGTRPLLLDLTWEPGGDDVSVRVDSETGLSKELTAQLSLLFHLCQTYNVTARERE